MFDFIKKKIYFMPSYLPDGEESTANEVYNEVERSFWDDLWMMSLLRIKVEIEKASNWFLYPYIYFNIHWNHNFSCHVVAKITKRQQKT